MMIGGPRLAEGGSHNKMDCEGQPASGNSDLLLEEGREQRRQSLVSKLQTLLWPMLKWTGTETKLLEDCPPWISCVPVLCTEYSGLN